MKSQILLLLMLLAVSCAPIAGATTEPSPLPPDTSVTSPPGDNIPTNQPYLNPFSPKPDDAKLTRGNVFISESSLVIRESYPPQISLALRGELPTPCHQLRVQVSPADEDNKLIVAAYSVVDPNIACTQVLEPFEEFIDMGTFASGHYSVWINGEMIGEFDS